MADRERRRDRGARRARADLVRLGAELRDARRSRGLRQSDVATAAGISPSWVSRIELGSAPEVGLRLLSVVLSIVGLDLSARAYPCGKPLRDEGHRQLLGRFRALLPPGAAWRTEVPLPLQGDQRGWDAQTGLYGLQVGVEAETRPSDLQALERRVLLKARDANIDRVIVVLADSARNRRLVRVIGEDLRAGFPIQGKSALAAIASAVDPGCNLLVLALPGVGRDRSMRASTASEAPPVRA